MEDFIRNKKIVSSIQPGEAIEKLNTLTIPADYMYI